MEDKCEICSGVDEKKEYNQPALTVLGMVSELTAGGGSGSQEVATGGTETEPTCSAGSDASFC